MKKRLLSLLLAVLMVMTLMPASALALSDSGDNDSAGTAQNLTLGDTISGQIAPEDDVDYYRFTLSESGRVTLDITSYMQYYSLYLYDTAGTELWYTHNNEYNSTVGFREDVYTIDLEAGVYYLKVTGCLREYSSYASTGSYSIKTAFSSANANEVEPNNSAAEANAVTLGSTVRGLIGTNDTYDFYRFTLTESGRVTLNVTSYMKYYTLEIYDTAGTKLWYTNNNEYNSTVGFREDVHTIDLEAGVYYLKVMGYRYGNGNGDNGCTGSYSVKTAFSSANANEVEPNNSAAEANAVTLGSTVRGLIGTNDTYDFYRFTLSESGRVTLNITSYIKYYTLEIYDTAGTKLWYTNNNEYNSTVGFREDVHTIDLEAGVYYLKVMGYRYGNGNGDNGCTGTYTITFGDKEDGKELHIHSYTAAVTDPSCTTKGYTTYTCSCGESYKDNYTNALGHNYKNGECTHCGAKDPNHQASHTHSYTAAVTDPSCTTKGYTTYTCSCGESYKDNYTNALGHSYANGKCIRCGAADSNYNPTSSFVDVSSTSYCYDAVQWAVGNGITNGTDSTHFSSNRACTRAQVVTFLWRVAGEPSVSARVSFVDVSTSSVYYKAIKWAVANGITKGTDATHFSPDATCTRGQVVTFMHRAANEPYVRGMGGFVDVAYGSYCYNAVQWAVAEGITNGTDIAHFSPNATCTRGQVVTFLYRGQ